MPAAPKPLFLPEFASGPDAAVIEPLPGQKASGWLPGTAPPAQTMNWLHRGYYQWAAYLNTLEENALTWVLPQTFNLGIVVVANGADITGNSTVAGALAVSGNVSATGSASVEQALAVGGNVTVAQSATVAGALTAQTVTAAGLISTPGEVQASVLTGTLTVEAPRLIGDPGQPTFANGAGNGGAIHGPYSPRCQFYRKPDGEVVVVGSLAGSIKQR